MKNNNPSHSNKIASTLLRQVVLVCSASALFAGCGQRGSLYLPTAPEAAQRSSIVETLSSPATSDIDKNNTSSTRSPMTSPTSTPAAK
jgi:predicted small lipoprotein YifL